MQALPGKFADVGYAYWAATVTMTLLAMVPPVRFLCQGWAIRKEEFSNRFANKQIHLYLNRFWAKTIADKHLKRDDTKAFNFVYDVIAGRSKYIIPMTIYFLSCFAAIAIVLQSALLFSLPKYLALFSATQGGPHGVILSPTETEFAQIFWPLPALRPSDPAVFAICGAFICVMQIAIYGYKTRTLLSTDLLWASFRLMISIPLGICIILPGNEYQSNF